MRLETFDTFLGAEPYNVIMQKVLHHRFPWNYCPGNVINDESKENLFMFTHMLVSNSSFVYEGADLLINPIMAKLKDIKKCNLQVLRAKLNFFTMSPTNLRYGWHVDIEDDGVPYETIIFYLNTNNGGTEFADGSIIRSVKNRALLVDGKIKHQSVGQTDTATRFLFNINYVRV